MTAVDITDEEFAHFQRFIHSAAGITLSSAKKTLVTGRLAKRLERYRLDNYTDYLRLLGSGVPASEVQTAVDLLTTNETYFFREPAHFNTLREQAFAAQGRVTPFRVWSAATATGEEAYSVAMVLADALERRPWQVVGSDISSRVLQQACTGHYAVGRAQRMPQEYLRRFCLRGIGPQQGTLLVERAVRERVRFLHLNLNAPLPDLGPFDMIFLRNVLIYFDGETKRQVVGRVLRLLRPDGRLCVGHSESLHGMPGVVPVGPSIYRKR